MANKSKRVVKDFFRGFKIFGSTLGIGFMLMILPAAIIMENQMTTTLFENILLFLLIVTPLLAIVGFIVNYVPLKVINGFVSIPASDQIRTFADLITINPYTGLYRRRTFKAEEIEDVANGYTRILKGKEREWNVVISGLKNGKSFSQRVDCSSKQTRDEIRNTLKKTIKGHVSGDFAI